MNLTFKYIVLILITSLLMCCGTNKTPKKARVNTTLNAEYRESRKAFTDQLSTSQYNNIKAILEKELHTTIPNGKSILINFNQKASNCLEIRFNDVKGFVKRGMEISSKMSTKYNAIDFFVYTDDAYYKDIY